MSAQAPHPGNGGPVPASAALGGAPPHSLEAEQSVLGAILLSERSITQVVIEEGLRPEDFYRRRHGVVFEAMLALYAENEPIDVLTVNDRLRAHSNLEEAGGESAVDGLTGGVPVAGNARRYARIVKEQALLRGALTATYEIQAKVSERDGAPRDIVEWAERRMLDVAHDDRQKDFKSIEDVLFTELDKLERLSREGTSLTGTPSGFKDLDDITGGFQPGNLVIIAGRPSMGKSALVTNIAENVALDHSKPVALFSLEMSEAELAQRFLASRADVPGDHLRKGRVKASKWSSVVGASKRLAAAPLWIDDSSDVGLLEVRAKARRLHQQHELGLIIIDYLQLLRPDGYQDSRVLQIGEMSRGLKILAGELQVPVIALSQLSRAVEARNPKTPMLSDLRESGSLEQDADVVMFIYRDEYYDPESERQGEADLIIAKHRSGGLGTVPLVFQKDFPRFRTMLHDPERYG
ncbi:MAG: replicative DNA helicase [Solirubrobacteraceae bacterium MAG38_C4-C5]|nr:replicative DNA helicase [Candidatus Siliceabacter maunaloa]